jgi:hypothetical protein
METEWVEYWGGPLDGEMREEPRGLFIWGIPADQPRGYYMFERVIDTDLGIIRFSWEESGKQRKAA